MEAVAGADRGLGRRRALELSLARSHQLAAAYLLALLPAVLMAFVQPVWQLTDEAQHADVLAQYAHGVYPVEGRTTLRPETVGIMKATGVWRWSPPEQLPRPDVIDPELFETAPAYLSGYNYELWVRRHIWWFSYEAMQPPLFYAAATPVWMAADHLAGPFAAVYAVRLLNSVVAALLAPLALLTAWLLLPGRRGFAVAAVVLTAALPGLLLNATQVTNDTFGAVLGSATVLLAAMAARSRWSVRWALLLGAVFGLTLLAKLTALGVGAALAASLLWPVLRDRSLLARQLALGALAGAVCLAVLVPWMALNFSILHSPVANAQAAHLLGAGTSSGNYSAADDLAYAFVTWWTGEHEWSLPLSNLEVALLIPAAIAAAVGLLRLQRRTVILGNARHVLFVLLAAAGGQAAWALAVPFISGLGGMTPGRYLYPAVTASTVLIAAGWWALFRSRRARATLVAGLALLTVLNSGGYALGYTALKHEKRQAPSPGLQILDVYGQGSYLGVGVTIDRLVRDRRSRYVWIHVNVRNDSLLPADWWPGPAFRLGDGLRVRGDYASSTPFPATLPGRSEYSGWVKLLVDPAYLKTGPLHLVFEDVAANPYREVGTIPIDVELQPAAR